MRRSGGHNCLLVLVTAFACLVLVGCITKDTERAWQENMSEALLPGYQDFRGLEVDGDIAWYLFSYGLPDGYDPQGAVPELRQRIHGSAWTTVPPGTKAVPEPCFKVVYESEWELQMRCSITTFGEPGFDEWRLLVSPSKRRVTAMFGNLDSPVERQAYPEILAALRTAHARE